MNGYFGIVALCLASVTLGGLSGCDRSSQMPGLIKTRESLQAPELVRPAVVQTQVLAQATDRASPSRGRGAEPFVATQAAAYRQPGHTVQPAPDGNLYLEAAEFHTEAGGGWQAEAWGENYYAATFGNTFLSRKAFLGAPAQTRRSVATIEIELEVPGAYLALVRYEAAYRFETQFRLQIEQAGRTKLDRLYGARANDKIWAFGQGIQPEAAWSWGAVENVVWEGHDALLELEAGRTTVRLIAGEQPEPAARRNVDLVMLTADQEQVRHRIEHERYLPLDGMLTQQGDVYLRVTNHHEAAAMTLNVPPGREHSPYWIHLRHWEPRSVPVQPGQRSDWVEVGSLLDSLSDGRWTLTASPAGETSAGETPAPRLDYTVEFAVRTAAGEREPIGEFASTSSQLTLAYDADTRYTRRIRHYDQVLEELIAYLEARPVRGRPPQRTLIYGYTFDRRDNDPQHNGRIERFMELIGATALVRGGDRSTRETPVPDPQVRGYIDLRDQNPEQLEETARRLVEEGRAERIAVVSLGDEIGLGSPADDGHEGFRQWARGRGLAPSDLNADAGDDWEQVRYTPWAGDTDPRAYYYSSLYRFHYGIQRQKALTDALEPHLPNAGIGANFSPHHGEAWTYLGPVHKWVSLFRERGMTQPWSEDYIWQVPVGSQQMNFINLDLFRAGMRPHDDMKLHYYVMPHWPGNTPNSWRRQFYGNLGHGMKIVNLFEFRPVQAAYTENHVSLPQMYQTIREAFHELGPFEDIIQDGAVAPGNAGLWFSEVADVWEDNKPPFAAAKRTLYVALQHAGLALDFVVEEDAHDGTLDGYDVLYLADRHVSRAAAEAIARWVEAGGRLMATAGAGLWDEYDQPNRAMRELVGVADAEIHAPKEANVVFVKQDLPFVDPIDTFAWIDADGTRHQLAAHGAIARLKLRGTGREPTVTGTFSNGSPAVIERQVAQGRVIVTGALPGLSYFKPAIPVRPVDRGTTDDSMAHFIPTDFDPAAARLIAHAARGIKRPVVCSEPLVSARIVRADAGMVIPLVNWSEGPVRSLKVRVNTEVPAADVKLAGGGDVTVEQVDGATVFTLDLDVADALIMR